MVRFPAEVIETYRVMAPPSFTFRGRDPRFDRTIPDDGPIVVTGSSAPNVVDPVTGVGRRATSADIATIAHLVNELPGFDVFSISTLADDAPEGQFSLSRFYPGPQELSEAGTQQHTEHGRPAPGDRPRRADRRRPRKRIASGPSSTITTVRW